MSHIKNLKRVWKIRAKSILQLWLTFFFLFLHWAPAEAQCSVHNHGCVFHALGLPVHVDPPIVNANNTGNSVVFYGVGSNQSGGAAKTDFDIGVLLPAVTGDRVLSNTYTQPTGPYIPSTTDYGKAHSPSSIGWTAAEDPSRFVYASQYQVIFNQNTAAANHTGDLNGKEDVPGAKGCPGAPGSPNCEAVVVTGNVPNGTYKQQALMFNAFAVPNPSVDLRMGAYGTGSVTVINKNQINGIANPAISTILSGDKAKTPVYEYEVYNRGFDPHAAGVAYFDRSSTGRKWTGSGYEKNGHQYADVFQTTQVSRITVNADGSSFEGNKRSYTNLVGRKDFGEVVAAVNFGGCPPPGVCPPVFGTAGVNKTPSWGNQNEAFSALLGKPYVSSVNEKKSYRIPITTYKEEFNFFGNLAVVDSEYTVTVYSKEEAQRLLAKEMAKNQEASAINSGFIERGTLIYEGLSYVPVVGEGLSAGEAIWGIDPKTGNQLSGIERVIAAGGAVPGVGKAKKGGQVIMNITEEVAQKEAKEIAEKKAKEIAEKEAKNLSEKMYGHHSDPKFLGGDLKQELTEAAETKTFQTYTKTNPKTGEIYCGRTSGCGTPLENITNRDSLHHMNKQGFGPAIFDKSSTNSEAIRGREQILIDANGGAKSTKGTSGNAINGISIKNKKRGVYIDAAEKEFGEY